MTEEQKAKCKQIFQHYDVHVQERQLIEECAELILKNGLAVKTAGDYDYNVVCALFGSNVSTYTYTRLKKEE